MLELRPNSDSDEDWVPDLSCDEAGSEIGCKLIHYNMRLSFGVFAEMFCKISRDWYL